MSPHLERLSTSGVQEQTEYLLDELEPIDISDFLLEERVIEIIEKNKFSDIRDVLESLSPLEAV